MGRLEQLFKDLTSADESSRTEAAGALEDFGPPPAAELPRLEGLLASGDGDVSYWAATLIGRVGPPAAPQAEALARVAVDADHPLAARERAVWALGKIGPEAVSACPLLRALAAETPGPRLARLAEDALRSING